MNPKFSRNRYKLGSSCRCPRPIFLFRTFPGILKRSLPIAAKRCCSIFAPRFSPTAEKDLDGFEKSHQQWALSGLQLLAINVDGRAKP